MTGRACKSAVDCVGFICQLNNSVDLIVAEQITDPDAIDAFNDMKEKMQKKMDKWIEHYVDFES